MFIYSEADIYMLRSLHFAGRVYCFLKLMTFSHPHTHTHTHSHLHSHCICDGGFIKLKPRWRLQGFERKREGGETRGVGESVFGMLVTNMMVVE